MVSITRRSPFEKNSLSLKRFSNCVKSPPVIGRTRRLVSKDEKAAFKFWAD